MLVIELLLSIIGISVHAQHWEEQVPYIEKSELRDGYDFIVVGAGTSGPIAAVRIAMSDTHPSVLLIEAGSKANLSPESAEMCPPRSFENQLGDIDWHYSTVPQSPENCCEALVDGVSFWPRGKVTGGSAVLNQMFWVYGNPNDWDQIFEIDNWRSKDVLPYFNKIENYHSYPYHETDEGAHNRGQNGPIEINELRNLLDENTAFLTNKFIETCTNAGYEFIEDINDWESNGDKLGCHYAQNNIEYESGLRNNAFVGYMKYLVNSEEFKNGEINLDILSNAQVIKIRMNENKNKENKHVANGVEFVYNDDRNTIHFIGLNSMDKGDIILSAGKLFASLFLFLYIVRINIFQIRCCWQSSYIDVKWIWRERSIE